MQLPSRAPRATAVLAAALALAGCGTLQAPGGDTPPTTAPTAPRAAPAVAEPAPAPAPAPERPVAPSVGAAPRVERIARGAPNAPYVVNGRSYQPAQSDVPMVQSGIASWYGEPFHGRPTATGEIYDMHAMSAAHKTMPLPSYARVRNPANGREVIVRVNDRGPFKPGRVIDLSRAAARHLGIAGLGSVVVTRLTHDEIRSGAWNRPDAPAPDSDALARAD